MFYKSLPLKTLMTLYLYRSFLFTEFYERVTAYKAKGLKVSLALGGWNDSQGDKYSRLVNSPAARARFIKHVLEFLEKYNFDGLDLDWEYPKCWQVRKRYYIWWLRISNKTKIVHTTIYTSSRYFFLYSTYYMFKSSGWLQKRSRFRQSSLCSLGKGIKGCL